jgi:poly(A) polymerase
MATAICHRLRFSNDDTRQILALVANHMKFKDVAQMRKSTLKRFVRLPAFSEHLELHRLDCLSSHGRLEAFQALKNFLAETPPEQFRPPRLLTGVDLQDMGYVPGPHFQRMLTALEDAQLEGQLQTRDQAILFIRMNYPRPEDGR